MDEVVATEEVERDRVDQEHGPQHHEGPEHPVLDGDGGRFLPPPWGRRQDAFCCSAGASAGAFFDSSLARAAYMSTYS